MRESVQTNWLVQEYFIKQHTDLQRQQKTAIEVLSTGNTLVGVQETVQGKKGAIFKYFLCTTAHKFLCNHVDLQHYCTEQMQLCSSTANSSKCM